MVDGSNYVGQVVLGGDSREIFPDLMSIVRDPMAKIEGRLLCKPLGAISRIRVGGSGWPIG